MSDTAPKPIRILHIAGRMNRAGAESWLMHVLRNMDATRFQMDFLVHSEEPNDFDAEIRQLGGQVIPCLDYNRPLAYARNFRRIVQEHGPYDIVHGHVNHFNGYALALAKWQRIPVRIAHSHSDTSHQQRSASVTRKAYFRLMANFVNRFATTGLAGSAQASEALFGETWTEDPRFNILHYGIDLEPYKKFVHRDLRGELGIPQDAFVVGHVGRFMPAKNHHFIVEVAKAVCECDPDIYFLLVGDGKLRTEVEQEAKLSGVADHLVFSGLRDDVDQLMMNAMDMFILPSHYEGLPLVGIEAQAAGLPCLISNAVTREVDIVDGLVDHLPIVDPSEWARYICAIKQSPAGTSQAEAQHVVEQSSFNIQICAKGLERMYARK